MRDYRLGVRTPKPPRLTADEARRRRRAQGRVRQRNLQFRKLGITQEWWDVRLAEQDGRCAICHTVTPNGPGKIWHVDHDHVTGKARGLVCSACNLMLGHARDDPKVLRAAADYLENFS